MKAHKIIVLACLTSIVFGCSETTEPDPPPQNAESQEVAISPEEEKFLRKLEVLSPEQIETMAKSYLKLAHEEFDRKAYPESIASASKAIIAATYSPKHPKIAALAYTLRADANLIWVDGDNHQATEDIRKALKLSEDIEHGYTILGKCLDAQGQYKEAIYAFTKAIEKNPNNKKTPYSHRAGVYQQLGEFEKAIDDFTKTIELQPHKWFAFRSRALLYKRLGKVDSALADFEESLKRQKENEKKGGYLETLKIKAVYLIELGRKKEALEDLNKIIAMDPKSDDVFRLRGEIHEEMGNLDQALKDYTASIDLLPQFSRASLVARAGLYKKMGKENLAQKDLARAKQIEKKPAIEPVYDFKK